MEYIKDQCASLYAERIQERIGHPVSTLERIGRGSVVFSSYVPARRVPYIPPTAENEANPWNAKYEVREVPAKEAAVEVSVRELADGYVMPDRITNLLLALAGHREEEPHLNSRGHVIVEYVVSQLQNLDTNPEIE